MTCRSILVFSGESEKSVKIIAEDGRHATLTGPTPPPAFRYILSNSGVHLDKLRNFLESGEIRPVLDPKSPFAFSGVKAAFAFLETGRASGKVVIGPIE